MTTEADATAFALEWIAAWNSHDQEAIRSHYDPNVVLIFPVAAKNLGDPSGIVSGIAALRNYFKKVSNSFPNCASNFST
jgi:ketosteroid isomerase-like protein